MRSFQYFQAIPLDALAADWVLADDTQGLAWTIGLNTGSTCDWTAEAWSVPINFTATQLIKIGHQPISLGGVRYWAESSESGPEGWARAQF